MILRMLVIVSATALIPLTAGASSAATHRRPRHAAAHATHPYRDNAYPGAGYPVEAYPGEIIARAATHAEEEPGVTSELSPDAQQTATGGPVGGVPGFDGGH